MKRFWYILAVLMFAACDNSYLESDNVEELVVEGWIENGHAPVVLVSGTLPVSSTPQPVSNITDHILRYAEVYMEKAIDDTSYVAKMVFHNDRKAGRLYQTFRRSGSASNAYEAVNFTTLDGSLIDSVVVETFMKPIAAPGTEDIFFHPGDTVSLKLATIERPMFDFWKEFADYTNSAGMTLTAPVNVKGNVSGAIGYWAGYGIDVRELVCNPDL